MYTVRSESIPIFLHFVMLKSFTLIEGNLIGLLSKAHKDINIHTNFCDVWAQVLGMIWKSTRVSVKGHTADETLIFKNGVWSFMF